MRTSERQRAVDRRGRGCPSDGGALSVSARAIARLTTTARDSLSKAETIAIAAIEGGAPSLVEAREIIGDFHAMVRKTAVMELSLWLDRACQSLVASFGNGVRKDEAAVRAAIISLVQRPD
jgi:transposase